MRSVLRGGAAPKRLSTGIVEMPRAFPNVASLSLRENNESGLKGFLMVPLERVCIPPE